MSRRIGAPLSPSSAPYVANIWQRYVTPLDGDTSTQVRDTEPWLHPVALPILLTRSLTTKLSYVVSITQNGPGSTSSTGGLQGPGKQPEVGRAIRPSPQVRVGLQWPAVRKTSWLFNSAVNPSVQLTALPPETRWIWMPPSIGRNSSRK